MTIDERADGAVVVSYDGTWLTRVTFILAVLFLGVAAYDVFIGTRGTDRLVALLASAATCAVAAAVLLEVSHFEFVPASKTLTWRRRWGFRQHSGSLPFASIQSVLVERPIGDQGVPSRRLTLRTTDGQQIPITVGYRPDGDAVALQIASRIRALLGHAAEESRTGHVKALVAAGKTVEAIRVLREEEGLNLTEAKRRVDELKSGSSE